MVCLSSSPSKLAATDLLKMETLVDSGIGSRSPTPDSNLSQPNSSKGTKAPNNSNHINNNSHNNTSSSDVAVAVTYNNNKTNKGSDKAGATSTSGPTAPATGPQVKNSSQNSSSNGGSNSHNGTTSSHNTKAYRGDNYSNNRHSSGHGQYKKQYHQNQNYGYGGNHVHNNHRYYGNGQRYHGTKQFNSTANYHQNNHLYQNQGQSYQYHQQYSQSNHHNYHHHNGHHHNGLHNNHHNGANSSGNSSSSGTNGSTNNSHHNGQMSHQTQYFNSHSGGSLPSHHHQNHHRNTTPQVFISSSDPEPSLSWSSRRETNANASSNANWSSPNLDGIDGSASSSAVPISLSLSVLNKGFYSPSPHNASPATSPSNTDSSDGYSLQEESGAGPSPSSSVTTTSVVTPTSTSIRQSGGDDLHYPSNGGAVMDPASLNGPTGASPGGGFSYPPAFPFHPSSGIYTYPGHSNHLISGGGRSYSHPNHHQLINQGLLMPADSSYTMGKADSSISNGGGSDSTLECWTDEGILFSSEDYPSSSGTGGQSDRSGTPDYIYSQTPFVFTNSGYFPPPANKKRYYNGTGSMSGKLSPVPQNQRHYYPRKMPYGFPREFYEELDPEEYVRAFSKFEKIKERPAPLSQNPQSDSLSEGIWLKFVANQQTTETFRKKMELWRDVYRILRTLNYNSNFKHDPRNFPTFGLQVVGSTMSGFGSNTSDVDMCLLVRGSDVDQRYEAVDKLQVLNAALSGTQWLENVDLIYAKVPILKFRDPKRFLEVDLNCNNFVGIRNTHLLYCYSQADWRLKPLVLVVKLWAHYHGINDAKNMTISSYSLVLMVIHFLQCALEEPVLPILQQMYPDKFNSGSNILHVKINEVLPPWQSKNKQNLGDLLIQFLEYYALKFDYSENAVSVRTGGTIPIKQAAAQKSIKNDPHQWKYLCIEEPFDRTNTARSVYDRDTFDKIVGIFNLSYHRLLASRNLESIFTQISELDARTMSVLIR